MCYCTPERRTPYCANCAHTMHREITTLRAENAKHKGMALALIADVELLRTENARMKEDAARYRWLRSAKWGVAEHIVKTQDTEGMDWAIDKAMKEQAKC